MLTKERARQQAIERYGVAGLSQDPALDEIARLAAQLCNTPVGAVTLLMEGKLNHLGRHGFDLEHSTWQDLPCSETLGTSGIHQSTNTRLSSRHVQGDAPLTGQDYAFYAGAAIRNADGIPVGSLSVLDTVYRKLSPEQRAGLGALSRMASTRLELMVHVREVRQATRTQQLVEKAFTEEKTFVAAVLDTVGALVVVFDAEGRIVRFNRFCELLSGYSASQVIGTFAWERLIPKEDVPAYTNQFNRARQGEFPATFENDWLSIEGARRRISWSTTALLDARGAVSYIITTGIDITVQSEAETAIRESEKRYRELVEGSLGLVCTHDLQGRILSINEQGAKSLGCEVTELVGKNLAALLSPQFRAELPLYLQTLRDSGEAQGLLHVQHRSGEGRVLAYKNRLVQPADGPSHVLGFAVDVTEQIHTEEQLRRLNRQSNSVLESIGDGIYGIDLEGRLTVVNPAGAQMLGYSPEELLGCKMHDLIHHSHADGSPYPEAACPIRRSVKELTPLRVAHEVFWKKDGSPLPVEYVACPQIEHPASSLPGNPGDSPEVGRAVGVVVAFTDTSERDALDRMKDEFISTVSHELRTPLTGLRAALGLVAAGRLSGDPDRTQQMMDIAVESTDRLVRLVNDILDLERIGSGKATMHFSQCSVESLFGRTAAVLQSAAARANVRLELHANDVDIWADSDRLLQTLTNLVANAIKFAPAAPEIETVVVLSARYGSPGEAILEVQDHGRGIPADQLQTIFERFKQVDASDSRAMGGTGLGLAICRSIITQHGGSIWATSTLGEGSTFHMVLPTKTTPFLR